MEKKNPEFKKTIMVGLGGAGKQVLTHLKQQFIDMYGIVPPCIKFLSLDTDLAPYYIRSSRSGEEISLEDREFLYLKVEQPIEFIESNPSIKDWFIKPLPSGAIFKGAGAVREVGRAAFFYHLPEFLNRIDRLLTQLNDTRLHELMQNAKHELGADTDFALSGMEAEIYICGSFAGGTGSGTFIDVSIHLRDKFENALIHGFFLLNWIYRNMAFAYRVPGNVYAALCELDNLQSISYGDKHFVPYSIQYQDRQIQVNKSPFNLVHLIDGRNEYGENICEVNELCANAATAIFLSVSAMGDAVASVVDNLLMHVNSSPRQLWDGRYPKYSSFGLSSLYYPAKELHSYLYHREAEKLCYMALNEIQTTAADPQQHQRQDEAITSDVDHFFGKEQLNILSRDFVRDAICPFLTPITFTVLPFEISEKNFPGMIEFKLQTEEDTLKNGLQEKWETAGLEMVSETINAIRLKMDNLRKDPAHGGAHLKQWVNAAVDRMTNLKNAATLDKNNENENIRERRSNSDNLKELAVKSSYLPVFGGSRKRMVANWADVVVGYLDSVKDEIRYTCEVKFYEKIIEALGNQAPASVEADSNIVKVLETARANLSAMLLRESESLRLLKNKPNQQLIGSGNTVVIIGENDELNTMDAISLDFAAFKEDSQIHNPEDYMTAANKAKENLTLLFLDYCARKLNLLKEVNILEAMSCIGKYSGDQDAYITNQFNHLFRLSSALWRYDKGRLNLDQRGHYDNIINFGVYQQDEGRQNYEPYVEKVKGKYQFRANHTYSTTKDPHRIWLLNFAAALPAYFLQDLKTNRQKYFNEISPTYHIDKYFEMNVPDLFPMTEIANKALRVIGMAIISADEQNNLPGIDVISDEKLAKGHKFTFNDTAYLKEHNYGLPYEWRLFRDMYDEIASSYDENSQDNMLDAISDLLAKKIRSMDQGELNKILNNYIEKVSERLEDRDFSRLISAKLTYSEIKELKRFLDPRGYNMDIDRYINGKLIQ